MKSFKTLAQVKSLQLAACALMSVLTLTPLAALAQVTVSDAWVRATVPHQDATGVFMKLHSSSDTRLVGAQTTRARSAEIHETILSDNIMKMRPVAALDVHAGKLVELKPGSYHVMLVGLDRPVAAGEMVSLTLVFESADHVRQSVLVEATARPVGAAVSGAHDEHSGAHMH